jgi:signal transduction histidine kinase
MLRSDARLVRLILVNLVGNAVKFCEHGVVEVSLSPCGEEHQIVVSDTGPGIPADKQSLIFEPFEQLEPVQQKHTPGVGLGLAIVREAVRALRGRVEVRSEVGQGSSFLVTLPSLPQEEAEQAASPPAEIGGIAYVVAKTRTGGDRTGMPDQPGNPY